LPSLLEGEISFVVLRISFSPVVDPKLERRLERRLEPACVEGWSETLFTDPLMELRRFLCEPCSELESFL
jgi:hypothetical protein